MTSAAHVCFWLFLLSTKSLKLHSSSPRHQLSPPQVVFDARYAIEAPPICIPQAQAQTTQPGGAAHAHPHTPYPPLHPGQAKEEPYMSREAGGPPQTPIAQQQSNSCASAPATAQAAAAAAAARTEAAAVLLTSPLFDTNTWQAVSSSSSSSSNSYGGGHGNGKGASLCCGQLLSLLPLSCIDLAWQQQQQQQGGSPCCNDGLHTPLNRRHAASGVCSDSQQQQMQQPLCVALVSVWQAAPCASSTEGDQGHAQDSTQVHHPVSLCVVLHCAVSCCEVLWCVMLVYVLVGWGMCLT